MGIEHKSRRLEEIYEKIEKREVVLPNFQRGFVWTVDEQKKLIASTIVQIPIGSTLHLKGNKDSFSSRALCEREEVIPTISECEYVLDGQQRLSTLKNAFYDVYKSHDWKIVWDNLFSNLRVRWFLNIDRDNDFFGIDKLIFDTDAILESEPRELLDFIVSKKILKTRDLEQWYHPGYIPKENGELIIGDNEKRLHIAKHAVGERLIPLYEVYNGSDGIHNKVIEILGQEQVELLKAKAQDKKYEGIDKYNEFVVDKLSSVESSISTIVSSLTDEDVEKLFDELGKKWIQKFSTFMEKLIEIDMPIILLEQKEAGRAAAIFEEINKGGTPLSIYDLIVAKAANADSSQSSLTDRIIELLSQDYEIPFLSSSIWKGTCMTDVKDNMLTTKFQSMYLNCLALLIAKKKGEVIDKKTISRNYVLGLSAKEINENNQNVIETIMYTYAFLQARFGVINEKNIIYDYMILPIVYLFDEKIWNDNKKLDIIEAWYWSWLFSGKYKERQDDQFVKDIEYLSKIILEDKDIKHEEFLNERILNAPDYSDKETLLNQNDETDNTAPKAIKDGLLQYILSLNPQDFLPNETKILAAYKAACNDDKDATRNCKKFKLQVHHIIPLGVVTGIGQNTDEIRKEKEHILNSALNLSYISECSNGIISDMDYARYKLELGSKIASHLLTLSEYNSSDDIINCLQNRYTQIQTTINAEISQLLS